MTNPPVAPTMVDVPVGALMIQGDLRIPTHPQGIVIFAHGSGSSRFSARNREVAAHLEAHGYATLLLDLLTLAEDRIDRNTAQYRFDIVRLSERVAAAIDWCRTQRGLQGLTICLFGASTGAAAALRAAAARPRDVATVISRGGRPDLAGDSLRFVQAPTLLIVGEKDREVLELNRAAMRQLRSTDVQLEIVPGASHLFEEPGTLEAVCRLASAWCGRHLGVDTTRPAAI